MQVMGKMLLLAGLLLVAAGGALMFFDKIPFLGKLPGDISVKRDHFQIFIPITTSILLSGIVSLIVWVLSSLRGK